MLFINESRKKAKVESSEDDENKNLETTFVCENKSESENEKLKEDYSSHEKVSKTTSEKKPTQEQFVFNFFFYFCLH